jgi:hypothetical protein
MGKNDLMRRIDEQIPGQSLGSGATIVGGGASGNDHGSLGGLSDDDHPSYLTTTRHNAIDAADHASGSAANGTVLTADGSLGAAWVTLCHVGASAPARVYTGRLWLDTSA